MEIQLPDFVLADLYKDTLVIIPDAKNNYAPKEIPVKDNEITASKTDVSLKNKKFWLGDNKKQITIVVKDADNVFIDGQQLEFLSNILNACKLNLSDVAIVNIATSELNYRDVTAELHSRFFLLFGIDEKNISLHQQLILFEVSTIDKVLFIKAPALQSMMQTSMEAKKEKAALWNGLKKMFGL